MSVRFDTLPNGLRVVTEHMPGLQSASIGVWVMAGGRHERVEQNGIAHFLEHMAFKGTARRSALQIAEEIEDPFGVDENDLPLDGLCATIRTNTDEILTRG